MTNFNDLEGFLRALEENPELKELVRAHILGEELLQLPVQFIAFVGRINAFMDQMSAFVSEQRQFNAEQRQFNAEQMQFNTRMESFVDEQKQFNEAFTRRLNRIEGDISNFRGTYARESLLRDAVGITIDMGFEYVRIVPSEELARMAQGAAGDIPTNELRSFRRADLIIEASDGRDTHFIAVEISYTADRRDTDRAQRNARFLADFTGGRTHAVIASVRNDEYVSQQVDSGGVHWHPLDDRGPAMPE